MLVVFACNLPDGKVCDMNLLLDLILAKLREYVENDYTLVLFNSPVQHKPSIMWMIKAYRSLGRSYRKNLKSMVIVHPTSWTRIIVNALKSIVSPKFGKKLAYVESIEDAAALIPINQIPLTDSIKSYDSAGGRKSVALKRTAVSASASCFFGKPVKDLVASDQRVIRKVQCLLDQICLRGRSVVGIFRRSPGSADLAKAKDILNSSVDAELDWENVDIHVCAVLIKMIIRELPEPLFPMDIFTRSESVPEQANACLNSLDPQTGRIFFDAILDMLKQVASNSEENRMSASNLAIVFAPNIVRSESPSENLVLIGKVTPVLTHLIQ